MRGHASPINYADVQELAKTISYLADNVTRIDRISEGLRQVVANHERTAR